jgi:hypothetical protein
MPLRNRVLPTGEIVAIPLRGTLMGNRGILHGPDRTLGRARWTHPHWICCLLSFKDRHRTPMTPGRYTELFFHDEAVALAAGHRPCAECRRADHLRFLDAWESAHGTRPRGAEIDRILHAARIDPQTRQPRRHEADLAALPKGTFLLHEDAPALVLGDRLHPFGPQGYGPALPRPPSGQVEVLTPGPLVAVLQAGYRARLHPSLPI